MDNVIQIKSWLKVESALENSFEISPFWITTPVNLDRKKSAVPFNFTIRDVLEMSKKKFSAILSNPSILSRCLSRVCFFFLFFKMYFILLLAWGGTHFSTWLLSFSFRGIYQNGQYKKAKRYDTERWTPQVGGSLKCYWRRMEIRSRRNEEAEPKWK